MPYVAAVTAGRYTPWDDVEIDSSTLVLRSSKYINTTSSQIILNNFSMNIGHRFAIMNNGGGSIKLMGDTFVINNRVLSTFTLSEQGVCIEFVKNTSGSVYHSPSEMVDALALPRNYTSKVSTASVSNPPTLIQLNSTFGTPSAVGAGWSTYLDNNGTGTDIYRVFSDGTNWFYNTYVKAL